LEFANGSSVPATAEIDLHESAGEWLISSISEGKLYITGSDTLKFLGKVTGDCGKIGKTGSGTLELSGDNSGFTGVFAQDNGKTILKQGGKMSAR
jgi:hypothetical protein